MKIENFERAKQIREKIQYIEQNLSKIRKMKKRDLDDDFNICRELAYDALYKIKDSLEIEFSNL